MYTILEQQTTNGKTAYTPLEQKADINEAESVFYTKLASAAISTVELHSVTLLSDDGREIMHKSYVHEKKQEASNE